MGNLASASSIGPSADEKLVAAAKIGNCSQISQVLADGADVNYHDDKSNTALMWASAMGHIESVETLINCKARLEERDKDGYTALHWAVAQKKLDIVEILIKHKADVNALNNDGDTPLHRAAHYDNKDIALKLIEAGSKINLKNKTHQTPLDKARTKQFKIWFYSQGARPHSTKFEIENENSNDENKNENDNKNDNKGNNNNNNNKKEEMKNEVKEWLESLTLGEYYNNFVDNGYDRFENCIYDITRDELKQIGIKMGHTKIILNNINERKGKQNIYNEQPGAIQAALPAYAPNNDNFHYAEAQEGDGDATKGGLVMGQLDHDA